MISIRTNLDNSPLIREENLQKMTCKKVFSRKCRIMDLKYVLAWLLSLILVVFIMNNTNNFDKCFEDLKSELKLEKNLEYYNFKDESDRNLKFDSLMPVSAPEGYSRKTPLIFIGGVPRSGTTLMRAMLDAHPEVRCGEETRIIPRIIHMRRAWTMSKNESTRLENAGITDDVIDSAIASFILEVIVRHGKPAKHLCNKDPLVLGFSSYVKTVFPNSKFILMIRDGRASVHSIITRKVKISGFDLTSYRRCLESWNRIIQGMFAQCIQAGQNTCLPVYYEQLVLHPQNEMKRILEFLNIPWNDAVLHHEKFIGDEISLSKKEFSTDQVIKPVNLDGLTSWVGKIPQDVVRDMDQIAPMLSKLGYDPNANPPNYGEPDLKILENTQNIKKNSEYWLKLAKKYSDHV